jgi:hypothetical protein
VFCAWVGGGAHLRRSVRSSNSSTRLVEETLLLQPHNAPDHSHVEDGPKYIHEHFGELRGGRRSAANPSRPSPSFCSTRSCRCGWVSVRCSALQLVLERRPFVHSKLMCIKRLHMSEAHFLAEIWQQCSRTLVLVYVNAEGWPVVHGALSSQKACSFAHQTSVHALAKVRERLPAPQHSCHVREGAKRKNLAGGPLQRVTLAHTGWRGVPSSLARFSRLSICRDLCFELRPPPAAQNRAWARSMCPSQSGPRI